MEKMTGETLNITNENIKVIAEHFPEAMEEGKIKFDVLKELLGEFVDEANERYQFTWNGKSQALKLSQTPSTGTLLPCKEKSKDWDTTENLYIEGDNLEVLKLLQKSYYRKVKMIYIDPPYNTGNDFVYKDDYKDNIKNYKEITKQECKANPETQGRYHTDWLNMMYPRLKLARNLLTDDGFMFISIDDNEQHNLKMVLTEIFGDGNIEEIIWQKQGNDNKSIFSGVNTIRNDHENIFVAYRNRSCVILNRPSEITEFKNKYGNADNDPRGNWMSAELGKSEARSIPNGKNYFTLTSPANVSWTRQWHYSQEEIKMLDKEGRIYWGDGTTVPRLKKFLSDPVKKIPSSLFLDKGSTKVGKQDIIDLFGEEVFEYPKPVKLIEYLINLQEDKDCTVLDFFSGSAVTAQATIKLNSEDNGKRKFIMVQLDEKCNENSTALKNGFKNVCEVGEERIRRAGIKIKEETNANIDYGFKVLKLDSSNLKLWNGEFTTEKEANNYFLEHLNPLVDGRTNEDLLYELLLKEGMPLTSPIEEVKVGDKTIYSIGMGYLMICLEDKIDMNLVEEIGKRKPESVIFRDSGFVDENAKINTIQELKKYGIAEEVIKSI